MITKWPQIEYDVALLIHGGLAGWALTHDPIQYVMLIFLAISIVFYRPYAIEKLKHENEDTMKSE